MADLEKVLKGLECCRMNGKGCRQCPYNKDCDEMPDYGNAYLCSDALELLKEQPEQKHGHWVVHGGRIGKNVDNRIVECTVCNNFLSMSGVNGGRGNANYCPNCGAKMDEKVVQDG